MKLSLLTLATASGLASVSQAYRLTFYLGANCRNTNLGTFYPVVDPPDHVCRGVPINAQSVAITPQDGPDAQSIVVFRQPEGCGGGVIASGTGGCMNIKNARSYQIHYR